MKKAIILVVALFVAAAAQANTVRPGAKKSTQKIDAAVVNGLQAAINQAQQEHRQEVLYADNKTSRNVRTDQGEVCRRAGAFLETCDKGYRPAPAKRQPAKTAAPAKTPQQVRAEAEAKKAKEAAKQKEAERKRRQREAFWQMYYESLTYIHRGGK